METNDAASRQLRKVRIIWALMFIAIIIYVLLVYLVPGLDMSSTLSLHSSVLFLEIILGIISIIFWLKFGIFFRDKYLCKELVKKNLANLKVLRSLFLVRFAVMEMIGIYGLVLGILGVEWYITSLFFIVSGITMIFCYPTTSHWNELLEAAGILA